MAASKLRVRWGELPAGMRAEVESLAGAPVAAAVNCTGGFSPGLASRLTLTDGRQVFVKAMDGELWPVQAGFHRAEARVAAALPAALAIPRFLGSFDGGRWVALAFECVDGTEPAQPWKPPNCAGWPPPSAS